jgi:hypothetical protein
VTDRVGRGQVRLTGAYAPARQASNARDLDEDGPANDK